MIPRKLAADICMGGFLGCVINAVTVVVATLFLGATWGLTAVLGTLSGIYILIMCVVWLLS